MPYCQKCGIKLPQETYFCPNCGAPVPDERRTSQEPLHLQKWHIAVALGVISILLLSVAYFMPWYNITADATAEGETFHSESNYYLEKIELQRSGYSDETRSYDDMPSEYEENLGYLNTFENTGVVTLVALVLSTVFVATVITMGILKKSMKPTVIIGIIAAIAVLAAPMYLMVALPRAMAEEVEIGGTELAFLEGLEFSPDPSDSFFGSGNGELSYGYTYIQVHASWGGTVGWFMALGGFILLLAAVGLCATQRMQQTRRNYPEEQDEFMIVEK